MGAVSISRYWIEKCEQWIKVGIRKSKAEIVEEGLKRIIANLDREAAEWEDFKDQRAGRRVESIE